LFSHFTCFRVYQVWERFQAHVLIFFMKYAKGLGLTCYCFSKSVNDLRLICYNFRMFVIYDLRLTCYCFRKFVNYLIIAHFSLVSLLMI
jgi:hypothetical protein